MNRKKAFLMTFVLMFLSVSCWIVVEAAVNTPVAVSPGSETEVVTVWQSCPTFSWSAVGQAASYRVAVFESVDANVATYEDMAAMTSPLISKDIPGPALSWTLSSGEKLKTGRQYAWYVQALDTTGNPLGPWSGGRIFKVELEIRFAGIEEKLGEILKSYGVKEETITNVLEDMKSEVQEVVVQGAEGAEVINTPGRSSVQGTEGANNTFYGQSAGASITTGSYDTFIGAYAGTATTSGSRNNFLGYYAGYTNTTGQDDVFLGNYAGYANTTGYQNNFLGNYAGYSNTTGHYNTFLGNNAGYSNTTGYYNTFLGNSAGNSNTTGDYNTFLGNYAGPFNTGSSNTFLGNFAGYSNTTANYNTFLGNYTGYNNSTGYENNFLGYKAGYTNNTGYRNTFLGYKAGYTNDTGYYNTFLGNYAGYSNTTGNSNIFLGNYAGYTNTTGQEDVFIGNFSGNANTAGSSNTFLGCNTGQVNTYGHYNTFLGFDAGYSNTTGYRNTYIGSYAGYGNSTGNYNTFIGYMAGYWETGSYKLYIDYYSTNFPLIYGEFDNDIVAINGDLGIGTKTPDYKLEVETTGENATIAANRTDGAINSMSATASYAQLGAVSNHPVRILVNNAWKMQLNSDNSLSMASGATCTAGGTWTNASSRSLKENIKALSRGDAMAALNQLNPVEYNYKVDKTDKHVGFIAEDVPDLVATPDRKGLSPMDITAVLTKVVQEQQNLIQEYKKIIDDLQERVAKLEKK